MAARSTSMAMEDDYEPASRRHPAATIPAVVVVGRRRRGFPLLPPLSSSRGSPSPLLPPGAFAAVDVVNSRRHEIAAAVDFVAAVELCRETEEIITPSKHMEEESPGAGGARRRCDGCRGARDRARATCDGEDEPCWRGRGGVFRSNGHR
nr:unnamed protein product [Digitaria exilis]